MVIRTVGWLLLRRLVGLVGAGQAPDAKDVEIAVPHHQLAVTRLRYRPGDRLVLARLLPRERWSVFLVTPGTLLRWHREPVAHCWTYPHADARSARTLDSEVVALVLRLARDNPRVIA